MIFCYCAKEKYYWDVNGIIYVIISALIMCFGSLAFDFSLQKGPAGAATFIAGLYPIVTIVMSSIFLGESFTIKKVIGIILAMFGIYLIK